MKDNDFWFVLIGVLIGGAAHFGRIIQDAGWPTLQEMIGFILQMGLIAIVAGFVVEKLAIESRMGIAVVAAMFALSAREIMPWLKGRAIKLLDTVGDRP